MAYFLSPIGNDQQCSANGAPLSGGKIYTYLAGSSTPAATYTDNVSGTPQANPIILNSLGLPASPIWMVGGIALKFIIKDSADVLIRTIDNVTGINDTSSTASEWTDYTSTPTYISGTSFSVLGDQTSTFQVNRRVRTKNTGGLIYGRITASVYASTITTVTVVNDSGALDAGLSVVSYGFLSYSPTSLPYGVYAAAGANNDITSLTALTAGGLPNNSVLTADIADGAVTPAKTAVGALPSMVRLTTTGIANGSTNTVIARFSAQEVNQGTDITYADSLTLGALFTINTNGVYAISFTGGANCKFGISLNATGSPITTGIATISAATRLSEAIASAAGYYSTSAWTGYLPSGSLIRAHTDATAMGANASFTIVRVA